MTRTTSVEISGDGIMDRPQETATYDVRHIRDLRRLVALGEGQCLEFKRKANFPDKIVREMVAFANSEGGTLLLGVGDDGELAGLKHPEDDAHVVRKALLRCRPKLDVQEEFISLGNGRTIIRYLIAEGQRKPYFQVDGLRKLFFLRVKDQSIRASREMQEIVRRARKKKDIRFHYGEHEKALIEYLDQHSSITLERFAELSGLKRFYASRKLVVLVLANVLRVTPHEKGDIYSLAF